MGLAGRAETEIGTTQAGFDMGARLKGRGYIWGEDKTSSLRCTVLTFGAGGKVEPWF